MRQPLLLVALLIAPALMAGCASEAPGIVIGEAQPPVLPTYASAETGLPECGGFCEPSIAVSADGVIAALARGTIAVSQDEGATFELRTVPPVPERAVPGAFQNDELVQYAPDGRLYYSALLTNYDFVTQSIVLDGVQVASSPDDGTTWDVNTLLSLATTPMENAVGADRQWLAFGKDEVYLTYHEVSPILNYATGTMVMLPVEDNIVVARSTDGGRTFSPFTRVFTGDDASDSFIGGRPVVDDAGRLMLAAFRYDGQGGSLWFVTSDDDGRTFTYEQIASTGDMFPTVAVQGAQVVVAYKNMDGRIVLMQSLDGGATWDEGIGWTEATETAVSSPWVEPRENGDLDVVWIQELDEGAYALRHTRGAQITAETRAVVAPRFEGSPGIRANTDFAHFAHLPDGRIATIYGDQRAESVMVAIETNGVVQEVGFEPTDP